MAYDLAIWKRSARTKTAMLKECFEAILEDTDHTAMDFFDENLLFKDFEKEYGKLQNGYFGKDVDDCPFLFSQGKGEFGNWILLHLNWTKCQETTNKIVTIALQHSLMVYDPQCEGVWGNRRPPKSL